MGAQVCVKYEDLINIKDMSLPYCQNVCCVSISSAFSLAHHRWVTVRRVHNGDLMGGLLSHSIALGKSGNKAQQAQAEKISRLHAKAGQYTRREGGTRLSPA